MIEKQIKTKYFDTNTRFVDLTDVATRQATFNKMFVTGDEFTPVGSVTVKQLVGLASCVCLDHQFQKNEVVEFKGADISEFNSQYRVIDVIDKDTFTFAYNETQQEPLEIDLVITGVISVRLAGAGWIGADGAYTSVAGLQILVDFDSYRTDFLLFGAHQEPYAGSQYIYLNKMRFFLDDIGFYNINSAGINAFNMLGFVYGMSRYSTSDYGLDHTLPYGTYGLWSGVDVAQRILANYDNGKPTSRAGSLLLQHPLIITYGNSQTTVETPILFAVRGACIDDTITIGGLQYVLASDGVSPFYVCISDWDRENV